MEAIDIIVRTDSPYDTINSRMLSFGALTHEKPVALGTFRVRCIGATLEEAKGRTDLIKYVIANQGYGEVLRTEEVGE